MTVITQSESLEFLESFERELEAMPETVLRHAKEAGAVVGNTPLPTSRTETYKYTRIGRITRTDWSFSAEGASAGEHKIPGWEGITAVFVNGRFDAAQSSPELLDTAGVYLLSQAPESALGTYNTLPAENDDVFAELNTANPQVGMVLHLGKAELLMKDLHILHLSTGDGTLTQPRHLFHLEEGAQARVVMSFHGKDASFSNSSVECTVAQRANFNLDILQAEQHFSITNTRVAQERDSRFAIHTVTATGALVRNNLYIAQNGEHCETELYGTYSPRDKQHVDNATVVDHRVPNGTSDELYKGVIWDKATGVFNGKVFVREQAQKTNAFQQNANILMSTDATMNSKPELEIYADDVQCSHGSTTGQFDEEAVYYLKTRGISDASARELLIEAFRGEVIDGIPSEVVREWVRGYLV